MFAVTSAHLSVCGSSTHRQNTESVLDINSNNSNRNPGSGSWWFSPAAS